MKVVFVVIAIVLGVVLIGCSPEPINCQDLRGMADKLDILSQDIVNLRRALPQASDDQRPYWQEELQDLEMQYTSTRQQYNKVAPHAKCEGLPPEFLPLPAVK